ncbi:hypothetical protein BURMUCGD2M_4778 [Burkholderia multivorans CGD2M]|uniref:Uncharacterized protein n=1 Tax=Burkholderia multivorans CGD2 TaxID=513052 RepID=B9BI82_9BURK|nr:hypothetical protein BURMUCGD2_4788 [Burkholderia multivorans CGD2]EEE15335.1 hypothetical protein BURMUCGD2M_4778 [Burkholderia multivorans CGD2M]
MRRARRPMKRMPSTPRASRAVVRAEQPTYRFDDPFEDPAST